MSAHVCWWTGRNRHVWQLSLSACGALSPWVYCLLANGLGLYAHRVGLRHCSLAVRGAATEWGAPLDATSYRWPQTFAQTECSTETDGEVGRTGFRGYFKHCTRPLMTTATTSPMACGR